MRTQGWLLLFLLRYICSDGRLGLCLSSSVLSSFKPAPGRANQLLYHPPSLSRLGTRFEEVALCHLPAPCLSESSGCLLVPASLPGEGTSRDPWGGGSPLLRGDLIRQQSRAFSCRVVTSGRFEFTSVLECPCPRVVPQMPVLLFVESSGGGLIIHSSIPRIHMEMPSWAHHAHTCR